MQHLSATALGWCLDIQRGKKRKSNTCKLLALVFFSIPFVFNAVSLTQDSLFQQGAVQIEDSLDEIDDSGGEQLDPDSRSILVSTNSPRKGTLIGQTILPETPGSIAHYEYFFHAAQAPPT